MICNDCPRKCNSERNELISGGICSSYSIPLVVRAAPHFGEEPCISGTRGSGAVFFSGCNLKCVFCQNYEISRKASGKALTKKEFKDLLYRLQDTGVHNINFVTPTHFTRFIAEVLSETELDIPVVWNSSGYESEESLHMLEGLVQVYMPDYKYSDKMLAKKYSSAPDYPEVAEKAIKEMFRQRGPYRLDENGILQSGVIVRHLILPGNTENSLNAIDFIADSFPGGSVLFSLMSQYTPMPGSAAFTELQSPVPDDETDMIQHYLSVRKISDGYLQDPASATSDMIPSWDFTGLDS